MGVYKKEGERNGEDYYQQLDSRRRGHVFHLSSEEGPLEWIVKRNSIVLRKWVDPRKRNLSLFGPPDWMYYCKEGNLEVDESIKVATHVPFLHETCHRIIIKVPNDSDSRVAGGILDNS